MTLKFVPPKQVARYALFVDHGHGRGKFKTYDDLGSVKNAYHHAGTYSSGSKILENVDGEWYTLFDIEAGTAYEDLPWVKEVGHSYYASRVRNTAVPMSREEYAEWRVKVERERIENRFDISLINL